MSIRHPVRIPAIDGLRGVAVVLVLAYHFDVGLPGGFLGVDVFFAISGFVVTRRLLHQFALDDPSNPSNTPGAAGGSNESSWDLVKGFYVARFWRLFPALVVMIAVVAGASALMNPVLGTPRRTLANGFAALIGLSNWFRLLHPDEAGEIARPLLHTWSLSIEEQFYVCLPFLLAFFRRKILAATYAIGGLCVLVSALPLPSSDPNERYFFTLARLAPLGFGVLLAAFFRQSGADLQPVDHSRVDRSVGLRNANITDAVFLVLTILLIPTLRRSSWNDRSLFPIGLVLIGLVSAGILGLLTVNRSALRRPGLTATALESRAAQFLGSRSYSLYLWHFPIAHLFMSQPRLVRTFGWVALSFATAEVSYRFIETPVRRWRGIRAS